MFIRELISNGSDALEKLRHQLITGGGDSAPMEIHLQTDAARGILTIQVHFNWEGILTGSIIEMDIVLNVNFKNINLGHWYWDESRGACYQPGHDCLLWLKGLSHCTLLSY